MKTLLSLISISFAAGALLVLIVVYPIYMPLSLREAGLLSLKYGGLPIFVGLLLGEIVLRKLRFRWFARGFTLIPLAAGTACLVLAGVVFVNGDSDSSKIVAHRAKVVRKEAAPATTYRPARYVVEVESWRETGKSESISVSEHAFNRIVPNDTYGTVYTRDGSLGIEWIAGGGPFLGAEGDYASEPRASANVEAPGGPAPGDDR